MTLVELPQMFGYGRSERSRTDVGDFGGESQQSSGDHVPIGFLLPDSIRRRGQTIFLHGALQKVHLPVLQIRRPRQLADVHLQVRHVCNDKLIMNNVSFITRSLW